MSKKSILVVKLVLLIIMFLIVLQIAISILVVGNLSPLTFNLRSELLSTQTFTGAKQVDTSIKSYSVQVEEHGGSDIIVEIYKTGFGTMAEPVVSQSADKITITQQATIGFVFGGGKIIIKVPNGSDYDYNLISVSGSIQLDAQSKNVVAKSTSGSVKIYQRGSNVDADSTSGSIKIYAPFDNIRAASVSGSIKAVASNAAKTATLESTSGSVKLKLIDEIGYTMNYSTISGSVKDEYNGLRFNKNGATEFGNKQLVINASTVSGSIKLCDWT